MEQELKPCPFCGGQAQLKTLGNDMMIATGKLTARSKYRCGCEISCSTFGCGAKQTVCTLRNSIAWTREKAIIAWNTRVQP